MNAVTPVAVGTEYTFRPARLEDMPGVHKMLAAIAAVYPSSYAPTLADVIKDFDDPWCNPETDSLVALTPDGAVVAFVRIWINPAQVGETRVYLDDDIHPEHREHRHPGLEGPLLDWLEARGAERLREVATGHPEHHPLVMQVMCWATEHDRSAGYQRRGFLPVRYSYRMRRDLRQPIPERPLPAGLTLRPYAPELDEGMLATRNESFSDLWHFDLVSPANWQQFFVQRSDFRPDLSFAVLAGEEVVAYSMNGFDPIAAERTGLKVGWIRSLGTRRAWRKRGLASALLVTSMRAFQSAGLEYAGLGVDAQNPTGALSLYEALGFVPYERGLQFHKTL
jgi:mycothiol synthase